MDYKDCPIVLVGSKCPKTSSIDIISNLRGETSVNIDAYEVYDNKTLYIHKIQTKYFSTSIAFYPLETINDLTEEMKEKVEGFIICFDSNNRTFLDEISEYIDFVKEHQIEFCMVLCDQLSEDSEHGVTYSCIKNLYNILDIIELERTTLDEDDDEFSFDKTGYEELTQALESFIWSNVVVNPVSGGEGNTTALGEVLSTPSAIDTSDILTTESLTEDELEKFESLLNTVSQFRPRTSGMSRDDRLNQAEAIAHVFEKLLMQDEELENVTNVTELK